MNDGFLSQEEIDALLRGDTMSASSTPELTEMEKDALGEVGNISMGSAATTLSMLLGRRVSITTPRVSVTSVREIKEQYPLPYMVIEVAYTEGLTGTNIFAMREQDALIIADLMMGGEGTNPPTDLNELYMSAVSEAMNQMMGATSTSMSTVFRKKIDIAPPNVNVCDFAQEGLIASFSDEQEPMVRVAFRMEVEDLIDSEIMQIISMPAAKELVENLMTSMQDTAPKTEEQPLPTHPVIPMQQPIAAATVQQAAAYQPVQQPPQMQYAQPSYQSQVINSAQNVNVQPAQFAPLVPTGTQTFDGNIGLIMDVPLQITVELGRTKKMIKDILELGPGSVVELDKLAGEPVDVLANGKLIAKGEVVVIDENFGVRITTIVSQIERMTNLQ